MIRAVSVVSLLCLLVMVLYLPSAHPPLRFVELVRQEQRAIEASWSQDAASRILARALRLADTAQQVSPVPSPPSGLSQGGLNGAVAFEMAAVNQRLFNSAYFRSIDALLLLAAFRFSTFVEWLPWLLVFSAACLSDGALMRRVKASEFKSHDPEWFAVHVSLGILTLCGTVVGFVVPQLLHPMVMPCAAALLSHFIGRALGCFHLRT